MKATLTFNLNDEDDKINFDRAMKGSDAICVIQEMSNFLRSIHKYGGSNNQEIQELINKHPEVCGELAELLKFQLHDFVQEYDLSEVVG